MSSGYKNQKNTKIDNAKNRDAKNLLDIDSISIDKRVGESIRNLRVSLGMTIDEMATLTGMTAEDFEAHEIGIKRLSGSTLLDLARYLNVSVSELMGLRGGC